MELITGKNKIELNEWYLKYIIERDKKISDPKFFDYLLQLPFEMQIGVLLAYYDSINFKIDVTSSSIEGSEGKLLCFDFELGYHKTWYADDGFKSRNEAYQEAFKKADSIRNKQLN